MSKNRLLAILKDLKLPLSLILWIESFLSDRVIRLTFDGQIELFKPIRTGIPQGSPISPILFLIYIRDLFQSRAVTLISYLDDISLTTSSKSFSKNTKILEREVKDLIQLGDKNAISFDIAKTELIHFQKNSKNKPTLKLPSGYIVKSKPLVKWLGVYFDENLNYKEHIAIKASKARQAFHRMNRLANISQGLSPTAIRQLYIACVTSVADYGSILWYKDTISEAKLAPL